MLKISIRPMLTRKPPKPEGLISIRRPTATTITVSTMPAAKGRVTEALERIVQLYDGWNKKEQATEWRQKLDEHKNQ